MTEREKPVSPDLPEGVEIHKPAPAPAADEFTPPPGPPPPPPPPPPPTKPGF